MGKKVKLPVLVLAAGSLVSIGCLLFFGGILSSPRDFSSPEVIIRLVDERGSPVNVTEVGRNWYDSDCNKEGTDRALTDEAGISRFPKVPANVGVFTGAWRKAYSLLGMCGSGNGAHTTVYVRYQGSCSVVPKGKPLHPVGRSNQDADGVWFDTSIDIRSNTLANLSFPPTAKHIDYTLSSSLTR